MRRFWWIPCAVLILFVLVAVAAAVYLRILTQRNLTAARLAVVPLMTSEQFRQQAQGLTFDVRTRDVTFTIQGTRWTVHPAPPPGDVPSLARQGRLLASVQGEVLYPGDIGKLLGAMPARVATYEFPGRSRAEIQAGLEKEGWKTAEAKTEELRRHARSLGLDPSKLPGGDIRLPGLGGKAIYPPLDASPGPQDWARGVLLSQGSSGTIMQCAAWSMENIPTTPPPP